MEMVIEGVLSIQAGDNPRILAMKLMSYLLPADRRILEAELLKD
jgi:chemotaxis protein MotA